VPKDSRAQLVRSIIGLGIVAVRAERELLATQRLRELTRSEERRHARVGQAIAYVHRICAEFARHGIVLRGQDLDNAPWWPNSQEASGIVLDLMRFISKAELQMSTFSAERLNLGEIDLTNLDLRRFDPPLI